MSEQLPSEERFRNEYEFETDEVHFCVMPTRSYISLAEQDSGGLHVMFNIKQARALREWLDKVLP